MPPPPPPLHPTFLHRRPVALAHALPLSYIDARLGSRVAMTEGGREREGERGIRRSGEMRDAQTKKWFT